MAPERSLLPDVVRGSYARRLGVALGLAILVMVVAGASISAQTSTTLQEDVEDELRTLSQTRAQQLDEWLATVERDVVMTARLPALASGDVERVDTRLDALVADDQVPEGVVAVHYLNTETMRFETSTNDDLVGANAAEQGAPFATDPPSFDGPDDVYVSRPFDVPAVDHPIVAVVTPVPDAENRWLVFMTDLTARAESLSARNADSKTVVLNQDGTYVAHPDASKILSKHPPVEGSHPWRTLDAGETSVDDHGDELLAMTSMETHDWVVMVHAEKAEAYALGRQINSDLIGLVFIAIITLGLVGVTVGSSTITSLRRLARRAEEMGAGNMDVDLQTTRTDEFGSLYAAFDEMRTSLQAKISEAEQAREEAEDLRAEAEAAREEAEREREEMEAMTSHLEAKAAEYGAVLETVAAGDLTARVDPESDNDAMARVGGEINETLTALEETVADTKAFASNVFEASQRVGEHADEVNEASEQVSESVDQIFEDTSEQNQRLEDAAAEMQNLSATAQQVASSAQQVATTSQAAAEAGADGQEAAKEAIEEMNAIEAETDETVAAITDLDDELDAIGDIVSVITDIAEQTNMLALNASIEAARAGSGAQGSDGFAVVADEVKNLAEETKEAAADIEDRIERVQSQAGETVDTIEETSRRVTDGVGTVQEAIDALETIIEYIEEADGGIQEIDDATEEQARTTQEVMQMIDELTEISHQTATEADTVAGAADDQTESLAEVSESARDLRERAEDLESMLSNFETSVDHASAATAEATDD